MKIYLQLKKGAFILACIKTQKILNNQKLKDYGYYEESSDCVFAQMKAIYEAFQEINQNYNDEAIYLNDIQMLFEGNREITLKVTNQNPNVLDIAFYYSALLLQMGLHPVIVYSNNRVAVGAWIYEDYDMKMNRILMPEFTEEAYDDVGCLLAVDCGELMNGSNFNTAMRAGCEIVRTHEFAYDLNYENECIHTLNLNGNILSSIQECFIFTNSKGDLVDSNMPDLENESNCSWFNELIEIYQQLEPDDPAALSILSQEVRRKDASLFFVSYEAQEEERHLHSVSLIDNADIALVAIDKLFENLDNEKKTLLIATEPTVKAIEEGLKNHRWSTYIPSLSIEQDWAADIERLCQQKEQQIDSRFSARKRKYEEMLLKVKTQKKNLEKNAGMGFTYNEVLKQWYEMESNKEELVFNKRIENYDYVLELFHQYVKAKEKCIVRDEEGNSYLDFSQFSDEQIQEFRTIIEENTTLVDDFFRIVNNYGEMVGQARKDEENGSDYLEKIYHIVRTYKKIFNLWIYAKYNEQLDKARKEDERDLEYYFKIQRQKQWEEELNDKFNIQGLKELSNESLKKIFEETEDILSADGRGRILSREKIKAQKNLQEDLSGLVRIQEKWENNLEIIEVLQKVVEGYLEQIPIKNREDYEKISVIFPNITLKNPAFYREVKLVADLIYQSNFEVTPDFIELANALFNRTELTESETELFEKTGAFYEYFDKYKDFLRRIFGLFKLDIKEFNNSQRSLLNYINDWNQTIENIYGQYVRSRREIEQSDIGDFLLQSEKNGYSLDQIEKAVKRNCFRQMLENCPVDLKTYTMNCASLEKLRGNLFENLEIELTNKILRRLREYCETNEEVNIGVYPGILATPEQALTHIENKNIHFEQLIICDGEKIPFYQVLYLASISDSVIIFGKEGEGLADSVVERARQMQIPFVEGGDIGYEA